MIQCKINSNIHVLTWHALESSHCHLRVELHAAHQWFYIISGNGGGNNQGAHVIDAGWKKILSKDSIAELQYSLCPWGSVHRIQVCQHVRQSIQRWGVHQFYVLRQHVLEVVSKILHHLREISPEIFWNCRCLQGLFDLQEDWFRSMHECERSKIWFVLLRWETEFERIEEDFRWSQSCSEPQSTTETGLCRWLMGRPD